MTLDAELKSDSAHAEEFARAVLAGLAQKQKQIPTKYHYDARGSVLFEDITRLDEYYPTRTEISLLKAHGSEIAKLAGEGCAVVEFGSGSSRKTHILLEHMELAAAYVPIDIDDGALNEAVLRLEKQFPSLPIHPVHADFNQPIDLPDAIADVRKLGFFPGSTIGNLELDAAEDFMTRAGDLLGEGSDFLIGADLQKDLKILLPAYDDAEGVTAKFTLNLFHRINRELDGNLDVSRFAHRAIYNDDIGRIEIYIESLIDQEAVIMGRRFSFSEGERVHVENSHKYTLPQFCGIASKAGWDTKQVWTDAEELFSLHFLTRA
ncbi:MAG: L-histidine N(alpha)-methyltransferase [Alphaproteobacteria bacterium]